MVHCRGCGKEIHETAVTCPHCGAPQVAAVQVPKLKTQTVAGLWCAFLGSFGAHRFYLGKIVSGFIYLLLFWTSIPGVIACVELLVIAFSDTARWSQKYNLGRPTPPTHWAVKVLALLVPLAFITGVVAAIAIPAYHDYSRRAHIASFEAPIGGVSSSAVAASAASQIPERWTLAPDGAKKMAKLKSDYPELRELSDFEAVQAVHEAFYKDLPIEQVAASMGVRWPVSQ